MGQEAYGKQTVEARERAPGAAAEGGDPVPAPHLSAWTAADQRVLYEHGSVGIFKATPDGRLLSVNPALARLFGYDAPAQMVAEVRCLDRDLHVDPQRRAGLKRKIAEFGRVDEEVLQVRRRDGKILWVKESAQQIDDADGRPLYYIGMLVDVTAEVEALEALRFADRGYREIFENAREGIYRSTLDGRQLRANPALVRLNGYESEEELLAAVGDIAKEWYVEPGRREVFARLMERDGKVEGFVSEIYRHKTRERIWIEENARLVRDESGRPLYYEGSVQEITDRKAHEAELWRARLAAEGANRAKSAFLANMSHELRTPLNAIIGFAEVMLRGFYGPIGEPRYQGYLEDIHGSGLLLLQLLDDILDLSKVEAGKLELSEAPVDLVALADDCLRLVASRARDAEVTLVPLEATEGLPLLLGDERRLRQIALNLLSNAIKYNRPGGRVAVAVTPCPNGGLCLCVQDSGRGIPEAELEHVFDPFVQLDGGPAGRLDGAAAAGANGLAGGAGGATGGRAGEGVGLGLPLARQLAQLHDGMIRLTSREGEGTLAEVRFPAKRCLPRPPHGGAAGMGETAGDARAGGPGS